MLLKSDFIKLFSALFLIITSTSKASTADEERLINSRPSFNNLSYKENFRFLDYLSDSELISSMTVSSLVYECSIDLLKNRMTRAYADCVLQDIPVPENVMKGLDRIPQEMREETLEMIRQLVLIDSGGILVKQFRSLPNFLKGDFQKKLPLDAIKAGLASKETFIPYMDTDNSLATDTRVTEHIFANQLIGNDLSDDEVFATLRRARLSEYRTFESLSESQAVVLPKYILINANDFDLAANREALKRLISIRSSAIWLISFGDATSYGGSFGYDIQSWCKIKRVVIQGTKLAKVGNAFLSGWSDLVQAKLSDSFESVGSSFMSGCSSLEDLGFPSKLTSTDDFLFFQCSKLRKVVIPKNTTRLKERFMAFCSSLEELLLPPDLQFIEEKFLDYYPGTNRKVLITTQADSVTTRTLRKYASDNFETVSIVEIAPGKYEFTILSPYARQDSGFFSRLFSCFKV